MPATFFVVGAQRQAIPGLVRQELSDGAEVGAHTYTHVNLAGGWQEQLQLTLTQNALAGAAGIRTALLRPPYSSQPDAVTAAQWRAYQQAGRDGYLIVLASTDTRDWARPGVAKIVAAAVPRHGRGAIIMMHDSGGNRSADRQRAAADHHPAEGQGVPVRDGHRRPAGCRPRTSSPPPRAADRRAALVITQQAADHAVAVLAIMLIVASGADRVARPGAGVVCRAHRRRVGPFVAPGSGWYAPPVSIVVPAYNEEAGIAATVTSWLDSDYDGRFEVIVVDDGSTDGTAAIVRGLGCPASGWSGSATRASPRP